MKQTGVIGNALEGMLILGFTVWVESWDSLVKAASEAVERELHALLNQPSAVRLGEVTFFRRDGKYLLFKARTGPVDRDWKSLDYAFDFTAPLAARHDFARAEVTGLRGTSLTLRIHQSESTPYENCEKAELIGVSGHRLTTLTDLRKRLETIKYKQHGLARDLFDAKLTTSPTHDIGVESLTSNQSRVHAAIVQPGVSVVWGLPATGKTRVIAKAVEYCIDNDLTVLITSPSQQSIDDALSTLMLSPENRLEEKNVGTVIRVGADKKSKLSVQNPQLDPANAADRITNAADEIRSQLSMKRKLEKSRELSSHAAATRALNKLNPRLGEIEIMLAGNRQMNLELKTIQSRLPELDIAIASAKREMQLALERYVESSQDLDQLTRSHRLGKKRLVIAADKLNATAAADRTTIGKQHAQLEHEKSKATERADELHRYISRNNNRITEKDLELWQSSSGDEWRAHTKTLNTLENSVGEIRAEIDRIDRTIKTLRESTQREQVRLIRESPAVGADLSTLIQRNDLRFRSFDVVVIDDAQLASPSEILFASTLAKTSITLVGDFRQTSFRIDVPTTEVTAAAPARMECNVFDALGIESAEPTRVDKKCFVLRKTHQLPSGVAALLNEFAYGGILQSEATATSTLAFVDVSDLPPDLTTVQQEGSSRWWRAGVEISRYLGTQFPDDDVDVVVPYSAQARHLRNALGDIKRPDARLDAWTIREFNDRNNGVVVLDLLQDDIAERWMTTADFAGSHNERSAAFALVDVISKARKHLYLLGNLAMVMQSRRPGAVAIANSIRRGEMRVVSGAAILNDDADVAHRAG